MINGAPFKGRRHPLRSLLSNNALVAVSAGLLQRMTSDEVEAVLGHEISHVKNGDMVMWFSRRREIRADAGGSELAGRNKMIAALRRLQQASGEQESLPDQLAAFGIAGGVGHGLKRLFLSHPPLAERIAASEAGR